MHNKTLLAYNMHYILLNTEIFALQQQYTKGNIPSKKGNNAFNFINKSLKGFLTVLLHAPYAIFYMFKMQMKH